MFELVPYLVRVFVAILLSRSCAVLLARKVAQKSPGEQVMASLPILFTRDVGMMQDTFYACVMLLKEEAARRATWLVALLHMCLWGVFALLFLAIGIGPLVQMAWERYG